MNTFHRCASALFHGLLYVGLCLLIALIADGFLRP